MAEWKPGKVRIHFDMEEKCNNTRMELEGDTRSIFVAWMMLTAIIAKRTRRSMGFYDKLLKTAGKEVEMALARCEETVIDLDAIEKGGKHNDAE